MINAPAALRRRLEYTGPAIFSFGFRPFFLGAAVWAALGVALWLPQYFGEMSLPTAFSPLDWHIHEMIYGYVAATVAGFLLTAIPNWTGRLPVNGWPLAGLAALWLAGRVAILVSAWIGAVPAALIDIAFLVTLAAVAAREIVAGQNWRNLRVLIVLGVLIVANVIFHTEAMTYGHADYGIRIAIAAIIVLISLIGGRIVPSFTGNWLKRENPGRLPVPFSRFDMAVIAMSAIALLAWIAAPDDARCGALLVIAGLLQAVRLARWAGDRTLADRLVLVLHVGYAFVPLGFLLLGIATWTAEVPASAGLHAWTAGAFGTMTLAVMTRASLGHTGRPLEAGPVTQSIYAMIVLAAVLRIAAALADSTSLIDYAGFAWFAAFMLFLAYYGPLLAVRKPQWADRL